MSTLYSQGFNFSSFIQKGVDPRTGQYTCAIAVYETPAAARNCPSLKLSLLYNPLNGQDIGLGKGWSFNLSSYKHRQEKTLLLSTGENYQVKETTSFVAVKDQKLKSFQLKKSGTQYQIIHKSGQIEVLSNANNSYDTAVPVKLYAPHGRQLSLVWTRSGDQPRLQKIQDGLEVLLDITYTVGRVKITRAPNTAEASTFELVRRAGHLVEVKLPLKDSPSWKFAYGGSTYLTQVTSPAGLREEVVYKQNGHRLPNRAPYQTIPYAISHTLWPGSKQPATRTRYSYSDRNFLAYGSGFDWKDGEDNLYRALENYQYSSTVQVDGGVEMKYTYNRFHLLVSSQRRKGTKKVTQTVNYYMLASGAFDKQPPQYQLPKSVQTAYEDTATRISRTETSQYVFDDWGNPTQVVQPTGVKTDRVYYPSAGETNKCPADPHGFQRYIKSVAVTPASSKYTSPSQSLQYVYRQYPTAAATYASYFVAAQEEKSFHGGQEVSSLQHSCVNRPEGSHHGRTQQEIVRLSGQYPTTTSWTYECPGSQRLTETVQTKSFDGYTIQNVTDYSLFSGLLLSHKNPAAVQTDFQYDSAYQLVKKTISPGTPFEATQQLEYITRPDEAGYRVTLTDAKGVQTRYLTDGLERVCRAEEQEDGRQATGSSADSGSFRVMEENSYDSLGQWTRVVVSDWMKTNGEPVQQQTSRTMEYDDWGQLCRMTESSGVIRSTMMDPINLVCTEGIEGQGKTKTQLNLFGSPIHRALLKQDDTLYANEEFFYDGLGRLIEQKDPLDRLTRYQMDCFNRITQTTWPGQRVVCTAYAPQTSDTLPVSIETNNYRVGGQSFDGLSRVTSSEIGGRTTRQFYQGNAPYPSSVITTEGVTCNFTYEPRLDYALLDMTSGNDVSSYQYDGQSAAVLQLKDSLGTENLKYLPSGLLTEETSQINNGPNYSASSIYSMAGKPQYYTGPCGQSEQVQYDSFGRPQQLTQGPLKVTFAYDRTSRLSEICGQGDKNVGVTTRLTYDDFSREIGRTISNGNKRLYQLDQTYIETGHVKSRRLEDGRGNLLRQENFEYDAQDRLVDYQCQGRELPVNEKGRQIQHIGFSFGKYNNLAQVTTVFRDGSQNIASYHYANQDPTQVTQIVNMHPDYASQINLDYNENGCLIRDEQQNILEYDATNRLTTVRDVQGKVRSKYRYDASGRLVCQAVPGKPDCYFHYRGDALIGYSSGDVHVSYVSDGAGYAGQIVQQGTSTQTQLWISDGHGSVMAWLDEERPDQVHNRQYTPYGFILPDNDNNGPSVAFNGQWRDPVTGWYHLGNGYRVYNPVLMAFHSPDSWSPFTSGEINPYTYCLGDPINRIDPSGHFSILGIPVSGRDLTIALVGIGTGILFGLATDGAGFAIEVGLGIAVGIGMDVSAGMIYDALASHKPPSLNSMGSDAIWGFFGGVLGEVGGKMLAKGLKALSRVVGKAFRRSPRMLRALSVRSVAGSLLDASGNEWRGEIAYFDKVNGVFGQEGFLTHGNAKGILVGLRNGRFYADLASNVTKTTILPTLAESVIRKSAQNLDLASARIGRPFYLFSCHGADSMPPAGQAVANALNRDVIAFRGQLDIRTSFLNKEISNVYRTLERKDGVADVYGLKHAVVFRPRKPRQVDKPMEID